MTDTPGGAERQSSTSKAILIVMLVAIVTAVLVTLVQSVFLGNAKPAVTGGVTGAVTAVMALNLMKKRSN